MITPVNLYNLMSDETRLRCLVLLYKEGSMCVCELIHALSSTQPKVSRHLSLLRNYGIVIDERKGQWVYYTLNPALPEWITKIMQANFKTLALLKPHDSDIARIKSCKKDSLCNT